MNEPDENSLVLATANNSLTFEVLTTVWAQGVTPAYLLLVDCLGNTVDMAMVFGEFKPERLKQALTRSGLEVRLSHRRIIVPGLTAPLAEQFREATEWDIEVGPICAAELPLFLGDSWVF
jgi:acetyl-CoA decarbonylase/synthase complex subunit gamma